MWANPRLPPTPPPAARRSDRPAAGPPVRVRVLRVVRAVRLVRRPAATGRASSGPFRSAPSHSLLCRHPPRCGPWQALVAGQDAPVADRPTARAGCPTALSRCWTAPNSTPLATRRRCDHQRSGFGAQRLPVENPGRGITFAAFDAFDVGLNPNNFVEWHRTAIVDYELGGHRSPRQRRSGRHRRIDQASNHTPVHSRRAACLEPGATDNADQHLSLQVETHGGATGFESPTQGWISAPGKSSRVPPAPVSPVPADAPIIC